MKKRGFGTNMVVLSNGKTITTASSPPAATYMYDGDNNLVSSGTSYKPKVKSGQLNLILLSLLRLYCHVPDALFLWADFPWFLAYSQVCSARVLIRQKAYISGPDAVKGSDGQTYRMLDGTLPGDKSQHCQRDFIKLPEGWSIAPHTAAAEAVRRLDKSEFKAQICTCLRSVCLAVGGMC